MSLTLFVGACNAARLSKQRFTHSFKIVSIIKNSYVKDLNIINLTDLKLLLSKVEDIEVVWLYGSYADKTQTETSDIDLAVAFKVPTIKSLQSLGKIESLSFELATKLSVDRNKISIVDINNIPIQLAAGIVQTGIILYSNNGLREAKEENRILSMWEIDHEYHRRQFG
jgi:predicted nucleotidyltransferase